MDSVSASQKARANRSGSSASRRAPTDFQDVIRFNPLRQQDLSGSIDFGVVRPTFTFKVLKCKSDVRLLRALCLTNDFEEVPDTVSGVNLIWQSGPLRSHDCASLAPHQRINRFPRSNELTRKDLMVSNLRKLQRVTSKLQLSSFLPLTFMIPEEFAHFKAEWRKKPGPWIVKPRASAQGKGIHIVQRPSELASGVSCVVCRYVQKPLLLDGYKCDVRLYVVVTCFDPLRVYLMNDGMVRLSTSKYDDSKSGLTNPYAHLTNYSVNKKSANFVSSSHEEADDVGFKRSLTAVLESLAAEGHDTADLMSKIEGVILKAICSVEPTVAMSTRSLFVDGGACCAEMYGFDILIDQDLEPWLLEVNSSPSIATDSPLDFKLKSRALAGFLNLMRIPSVSPERPRRSKTDAAAGGTRDMLRDTVEEAQIAEHHGFVRLAPDIKNPERYLPFLQDVSCRNASLHQMLRAVESEPAEDRSQAFPSSCNEDQVSEKLCARGESGLQSDSQQEPVQEITRVDSVLSSIVRRQTQRARQTPSVKAAGTCHSMRSPTLADIESVLDDLKTRQSRRLDGVS